MGLTPAEQAELDRSSIEVQTSHGGPIIIEAAEPITEDKLEQYARRIEEEMHEQLSTPMDE